MADPRLEIERKYLLSALPPVAEASPWMDIEQGYLPGEVLVERLRRERDENGERRYRTVKAGSGLSRVELEEPATAELFDAMWVFTAGRRLRKRRYLVPDVNNRVTWEVDSFTDRPLVLAEVELTSEDQETVIPEWLAPYLVREVTGETAYLNHEWLGRRSRTTHGDGRHSGVRPGVAGPVQGMNHAHGSRDEPARSALC